MKKTLKMTALVLSLSALTGFAHAAHTGGYAGLGLGASQLDTSKKQLFEKGTEVKTSQNKGGLGGRVFGGYNFNQYVGVETGYSRYAQSKYKASSKTGSSSLNYSMSALDLVGKAYLPLGESNVNVYGLAGAAYVKSTTKYTNGKAVLAKNVVEPIEGSKTHSKIRPIVGVGTSYNIPDTNVVTNLEFSHIQGSGNVKTSPNAIPSANLMTLNLAYNFN